MQKTGILFYGWQLVVLCLVAGCRMPQRALGDNARIITWGNLVTPHPANTVLRNFFPVGVVCVPGQFHSPNVPWRWLGPRDASGRLQALLEGTKVFENLQFPLPLSGVYTVQFLVPDVQRRGMPLGPLALQVQLSGDKQPDLLTVPKERKPAEWITWKTVELTHQTLIIGHPAGDSSAFSGIRFIPQSPGPTVTWQGKDLLEPARHGNKIYEDNNAEDVGAYFQPVFEQIQKLHLNTVAVSNNVSPSEQLAILDQAQRYGLKVLLSEEPLYSNIKPQVEKLLPTDPQAARQLVENTFKPVIDKVKNHPALLGYIIHDEPFVEEAPGYRLVYQYLKEIDPGHPATGYLCRASWDSDSTSSRGVDNMKKFVDAVDAQVLFNDLYPIRNPAANIAGFLDHYAVCLDDDVRQAGGRPLWITAQSYRYNTLLRDPTPAEIRVQAYLSMAHGATGIIFYNYNSLDSSLFDAEGQPTPDLDEVGRVAADLTRLAPVMLTLQRLKVDGAFPAYLDVQGFSNNAGGHFVMAVNKDTTAAHFINLALPDAKIHQVIDVRTGEPLSLTQRESGKTVQLDIQPGDGILLQVK